MIGIVLLVFVNKKSYSHPYILVLQCENHASEQQAKGFVAQYVNRMVVKSKSVQRNMVELNLEVRLKDDNTDFVNTLSTMKGVQSAVLVSYNGDYMN